MRRASRPAGLPRSASFPVGASLLAKGSASSAGSLADTALSRAGSLPQVLCEGAVRHLVVILCNRPEASVSCGA
ncbi:MAG: hypothetical protein C0438_05775 [Pseudomonas sp.]|nr:hypothetical protein [Pseudomonas sp.]